MSRASGLIVKDLVVSSESRGASNKYNQPVKRKSRSGYIVKKTAPLHTSSDLEKDNEDPMNDRSQELIEEHSFEREVSTHRSLGAQMPIHVGQDDLLR